MRKDTIFLIGLSCVVLLGILFYYGVIRLPQVAPNESSTQSAETPAANPDEKLVVTDTKVGTGPVVKSGDTISINYTGTLKDGTKFDSSYDRGQPFETKIGVGEVIEGWDQGIIGMKVGGKRRLVIPPSLGYGDQAAGSIPPNSTLIFDVELMGIK
jgi:peptidylprolyl isomerase